jgi:hypothetical protein
MIGIGLRNVNSLPTKATQSENDILLNDIMEGQFFIFCATEVNLAWNNLRAADNLKERFKGKLEFAHYVSSNNLDKQYKEQYQRGGTLINSGSICARIIESRRDKSILGRWSWVCLRGENNSTLVVCTVY